MKRIDFTTGENLHKSEAVTKRNPVSKIRRAMAAHKGAGHQATLFPVFPTWAKVKSSLETLPQGWRTELAGRLNLQPSAVSMFMERKGQPSYDRVCDIIVYLHEKGVAVE